MSVTDQLCRFLWNTQSLPSALARVVYKRLAKHGVAPDHPFTQDFFGIEYQGNLNNNIDFNINFYEHNCCTDDYNFYNGLTNHNIDDFINNASAHGGATAHHQRIRQQHTRVKQGAKTATQQTWYAVTLWRFGVVRGLPRVECPQSRQPAHGETVAICLYLSIGPCSRVGGHPKYAVLPVVPRAEHHC